MAVSKDLSAAKIVDSALTILREHGLAALSMRRVATALDVAPSALYWHVQSKQELLALLAEQILAPALTQTHAADVVTQALAVRAALLSVRDGAEVVSFAQALRPRELAPLRTLHTTLSESMPALRADWAGRTIIHYVLGEVAEEQNYAELVRAGILPGDERVDYSAAVFLFGIEVILTGLAAR